MTEYECVVCGEPAAFEIRRIGTDTFHGELCNRHHTQLLHKGQPNVEFDIGLETENAEKSISNDDLNPIEDVKPLCKSLDLSVDVIDYAAALYECALIERPINRTPRVVAAASVYLAAMLENEKITQQTVSEHSNVSVASISTAYLEIAEQEGLRTDSSELTDELSAVDRLVDWFRRLRQ